MTIRNTKACLAVFFIFLGLVSELRSETVNINFGENNYKGSGVVGEGTFWNHYYSFGGDVIGPLLDSHEGPTTISVSALHTGGFWAGSEIGDTPDKLLRSGFYGPFSFTISGLDIESSFDVYVFLHDKAGAQATLQLYADEEMAQTPRNTIIYDEFIEGGNYVVFRGVKPSSDGTILGISAAYGGLNAIQIHQVPESSLMSGVLLGGVLMLSMRWWRRSRLKTH